MLVSSAKRSGNNDIKNKNFEAPNDVMLRNPLLYDSCTRAKFPDIGCSEDTCQSSEVWSCQYCSAERLNFKAF
jgi:hypothetical protein